MAWDRRLRIRYEFGMVYILKWGGPPGPRPAPWPAFYTGSGPASRMHSGSGGIRADQGVRPTL